MFEFERITSMNSLIRAWQKVSAKNACSGVDGVDISYYRTDLCNNLRSLQTAVASGYYCPFTEKTYSRENREISIHCIDDKIIQTAAADVITSAYTPSKCVHGFIKNRSIFTAKKSLDGAIKDGINEYFKTDINHFYDSIDGSLLLGKLKALFSDSKFLSLTGLLIQSHYPGISTGSCLSPALANLYLADFDDEIDKNSVFYSRYVDDMIVAPASNLALISKNLDEVGLKVNQEKSKPVNIVEGFTYLGFDIQSQLDSAIQNGDFSLAEEIYVADQSDIATEPQTSNIIPAEALQEERPSEEPTYEIPNHIGNVMKKCHIVKTLVEKAKKQKYLAFPEKSLLLQLFHCLGKDGGKFIHFVLGHCEDYDYAETQRRINKYGVPNPIGCKKLCERFGSVEKCVCNFSQEKIYPTPIIHARRVNADCFKPTPMKDSIGHFKSKNPEHRAEDALAGLLELNKKAYEIREQQNVFTGQIESLFERNNIYEFQTPQGLLIKNEDGLFIKVG